MLRTLIERLASRWSRPRPATPAAAGAAGVSDPLDIAALPSTLPAPPAPASLAGIGARRPLLRADGAVAGYEFRLSETLIRRAERPAQAAYTRAILTAMRATADADRAALVELPARWLLEPQAAALFCPGMMLCLRPDAGADSAEILLDATQRIRATGAQAGWIAEPPLVRAKASLQGADSTAAPPDFLLLRAGDPQSVGPLLQAVKDAAAGTPRPRLVGTDLPGLEVLELALGLGLDYASGSMSRSGETEAAGPISPEVQHLCHLLNRLLRGEDPTRLVDDIKRDLSLSVQLLRKAGSAHWARGRTIDTVEAAVLLMGHDELCRWLSNVLVRSAGTRATRRAVQEVTLARARLLELLAGQRGESHPSSFFTLGLASMLPTLLDTSTSEALRSIELAPEAVAAVLDRSGPWFDYLELAQTLDRHDLELAEVLALPFGGLPRVLELSEQAWAWTAGQDPGTG